MISAKKVFLTILCLFILLPPLSSIILGRLWILVTDSKGAPIPGVKISIVSTRTAVFKKQITTDKEGIAVQGGLENHIFEVTCEKEGYKSDKRMIKMPAGLTKKEQIILYAAQETGGNPNADDPGLQAIDKYNEAAEYLKEQNYEKALPLLEEAVRLKDTIYQAHYQIGVIYYTQEKFDAALEHLDKTVALNDKFEPAYRLLAAVYEKKGDKARSEKCTKLAQEIGGESAIDKYNKGIKFFNEGNMDSAILALEEVVKLDPALADAYYHLGMTYLNKGNTASAITNLEKYVELDPKSDKAETARSMLKALKK